jgi:hypothetical protein
VNGQLNVRGPLLARGPVELSNTMSVLSDVAFGAKLAAFATNLGSILLLNNGKRFDGLKMGSTIPSVYFHGLKWLQIADTFSWLRVTGFELVRMYLYFQGMASMGSERIVNSSYRIFSKLID